MSEWKEYLLGDVCKEILTGGDASKYNATKTQTLENTIPIYANSIENDGLYGYCNTPVVTSPAVTVAARGAGTGFVALRKIPYVPIVRLISLIPNQIADTTFLYYTLKLNKLSGDGSAIPQLTVPMIKKEKVYLPRIKTQQKIAAILSSLDDKIELNNRINKNLEEQAQALFRRWFVDFEFPNEEGKPYKSSGGTMVDSELGEIPQGWEVNSLLDIITLFDSQRKPLSSLERGSR